MGILFVCLFVYLQGEYQTLYKHRTAAIIRHSKLKHAFAVKGLVLPIDTAFLFCSLANSVATCKEIEEHSPVPGAH